MYIRYTDSFTNAMLLSFCRDKTRTHTQLADEFKLTEEIVEKLNTIARIPMVELDGDDYVAK